MSLTALMWIVVLLPLAGAAASFLAESPRRAAQTCVFFSACSAAGALIALAIHVFKSSAPAESAITFWTFNPMYTGTPGNPADRLAGGPIQDFHVQIGIIVDGLSTVLVATTAVISVAVQAHSVGFLRAVTPYRRHFWQVSLLTFAAMGTFASANLFTTLLMWGLTGVLGSLIAGHWGVHPDGAAAGRRVAIWQRSGDLALLLAVVVTYLKLGPAIGASTPPPDHEISDPFNFGILNATWHRVHTGGVAGAGTRTLVVIAVLVLVAAGVRAALVPFHAWLLGTVDSPTPAAGFMQSIAVTGGGAVLVARLYPLFVETPHMLTVLAFAGAIAAVFGAVIALMETDILRLMSAATLSHLGLVFIALGTGGFAAGMFHLYTHAFFGAALFLCSANLIVVYKTREVAEMGGAWKQVPATAFSLLLASATAAGVALLGGFWSTRAVVASALNDSTYNGAAHFPAVRAMLVVAVMLTVVVGAAYPIRMFLSVARNQPIARRGFSLPRVRDVDRAQRVPALILAVIAAASGFVGIPGITHTFGHYVTIGVAGAHPVAPLSVAAYVITLLGVGAGVLLGVAMAGNPGRAPIVGRVRAGVLAAADPQAVIDRVAAFAVDRPAKALTRVDHAVDHGLLLATGDAIELAASAVASRRGVRLAAEVAGGVAVALVVAAAVMLGVSGHLPGVRPPR